MLPTNFSTARQWLNPRRWICWGILVGLLGTNPGECWAQKIVSFEAATRQGLERAWFAQVQVDPARHRVSDWTLHGTELYALTTAGTLHALDALTGKTLWIAQTSAAGYPCAGPAVNADYVAVMGRSHLVVLDPGDGHLLWSRPIVGASDVAPALSDGYAYVATLGGRLEGHSLTDPIAAVWQYQSAGHIFQQPTTTGQVVTWSTDRGNLYVADANQPRIPFRAETVGEIVSASVAKGGYLYAGDLDGYLYSFDVSINGAERWRYATGLPITSQPAVVDEQVFVASQEPVLHAVDVASGRPLWRVHGIVQFAAHGDHRVYGVDRNGSLIIVDGQSGAVTGRLTTAEGVSALSNDQSDRIYLVEDHGLVQCLHEFGADRPSWYRTFGSEEEGEGKPAPGPGEAAAGHGEVQPAPGDAAPEDAETPIPAGEAAEEVDVFDDSNPFD